MSPQPNRVEVLEVYTYIRAAKMKSYERDGNKPI